MVPRVIRPRPALMTLAIVILTTGLASIAVTPSAAQTCWNWMEQYPHEMDSQLVPYDGCPGKLAVFGNYVYAALSSEIVVLDLSDHRLATEVHRWTVGGLVRDLVTGDDGSLTVLRAEDPGTASAYLEIYSLTDPAHPAFESNIPFTATSYEFTAAGGLLYARDGALVQIFDISDPATPTLVGSISQSCTDLSADVGRLYFAVGSVIHMYDTSVPSAPSLVGWWTAPSSILDIEAHGDQAYLVYGDTFLVLDFQNPLIPQVTGEIGQNSYSPWTWYDLMRVDDMVYVRRSLDLDTKELLAIDVSDPTDLVPVWVAPLDLVYSIAAGPHFVVVGERDYYTYEDPRLTVFSFDPPSTRPAFVEPGPGAPLTDLEEIAVVDGIAWWGGGYRLTGVDVSSMPTTAEVGSINVLGSLRALAGQDGLLYLGTANTNWGLQVYDVSDPATPVAAGHVAEFMDPLALAIGNGFLYVADSHSGLVVISLQDPANPTFVQRIALPGTISDVAVTGDLLLIAANVEGLLVADCSDPENPTVVGRTPPGMKCYGVATDGSYAYSRYFDLSVVDLAVPTSPTIVAQIPSNVGSSISGEGGRIAYHDGFLYYAAHTDGLQMIDVRDPTQPRPITTATVATYAKSVRIHDDHVLLVGSPFVDGSTTTPYEGLIGFPVQCTVTVGAPEGPVAFRGARLSIAPNPFNPTTLVSFSGRSGARATVRVYDARGRLIQTLFDGIQSEPEQSITWKPEALASGVYFIRYDSEGRVALQKTTLLK